MSILTDSTGQQWRIGRRAEDHTNLPTTWAAGIRTIAPVVDNNHHRFIVADSKGNYFARNRDTCNALRVFKVEQE